MQPKLTIITTYYYVDRTKQIYSFILLPYAPAAIMIYRCYYWFSVPVYSEISAV